MAGVVVVQLGSRQDYTVPIALQQAGLLKQFFTDVYVNSEEASLFKRMELTPGGKRITAKALSRHNPNLDYSRVVRFIPLGLLYLRSLARSKASISRQYQAFMDFGDKLNNAVLEHGLPECSHVYAFDHAARQLFRTAKSRNSACILDQIYPAIFEEQIEIEEEERWPDWPLAPRRSFYESAIYQKWREIQIEEWQLADTVIVGSSYSKQAICKVFPEIGDKLRIVPLTVNLDKYRLHSNVRSLKPGPLRVLYVGNINLRKGIPYLLQAFARIDPGKAKLTLAGNVQIHQDVIRQYAASVEFLGPIPHSKIAEVYHAADLFILPTISDGFGAVMLEAMATGLPVISSDHSGDIVVDGYNGFRIPIRRPDAVVESIEKLISQPSLLSSMSEAAIATSQMFSMESYVHKLCQALALECA